MSIFSYAWSLPVTWQRWQSHHSICHRWKSDATHKLHGSMFYRTGVMANQSFILWEYTFLPVLHCDHDPDLGHKTLLNSIQWPWPDDLHIRTWPIFPGDILDVQIWTSYVKAFKSYHLTDRQTDTAEIIYHTALKAVNNTAGTWWWWISTRLWFLEAMSLS